VIVNKSQCSKWLQNPHIQTIIGGRLRSVPEPQFRLEVLELEDDDFLEVFWGKERDGPVICLLHGLEGSIRSKYISGLSSALAKRGFQTVAMHHRSCGGRVNRLARAYHSGMTEDISRLFQLVKQRFPKRPIAAAGFSLGGNMVLNYLIEEKVDGLLDCAVVMSPPVDLRACSDFLNSGVSGLYQWFFMRSLRKKTKEKRALLEAEGLDVDRAILCRDFWGYDQEVTAPLHGFEGAEDYYERCSTKSRLSEIETPYLFIASKDDPITGPNCIPNTIEVSAACELCITDFGGHVGFMTGGLFNTYSWGEQRIVQWFVEYFTDD
jgi:predicted alpha/beta-fold hydrolase